MFTSSSFYVDENCTYPTLEEQVGMARKIAESLSSDTNKQSKGANMFYRRVKRSHKWVHQGMRLPNNAPRGGHLRELRLLFFFFFYTHNRSLSLDRSRAVLSGAKSQKVSSTGSNVEVLDLLAKDDDIINFSM